MACTIDDDESESESEREDCKSALIPLHDIEIPSTFLLPEFTKTSPKPLSLEEEYDLFSNHSTIEEIWTEFAKIVIREQDRPLKSDRYDDYCNEAGLTYYYAATVCCEEIL